MNPEVRKPEVSRMQPPTGPWTLEAGLYAAAFLVLAVGLGIAFYIYLTAGDNADIAMQQITNQGQTTFSLSLESWSVPA